MSRAGRFDPGASALPGGIFGGGAWAESAARGDVSTRDRRAPVGRNGKDPFMQELEQAEIRDMNWQQQQMQQQQQFQQMQQQQQQQVQLSQLHAQQEHVQQFRQQQSQSQMQMQMMQDAQQQHGRSGRSGHQGPTQPRGILKRAPQSMFGSSSPLQPLSSAPPPPPQAAGGYRRTAQDRSCMIADYTNESRVLQAPGGDSSFSLTDGSGSANPYAQVDPGRGRLRKRPTELPQPPQRQAPSPPRTAMPDDLPAGYMPASHATGLYAAHDGHGYRRDPNRPSQPGGIVFG